MARNKMRQGRALDWRAWAAASVFVGLIVGGLVIGRPTPDPQPAAAPSSISTPARPRVIPSPLPALTRADLIEAAALAASRTASGERTAASDLPGRRFALSLPFGCEGPTSDLKQAADGWSYDAATTTLRIKVTPQVWTEAPLLRDLAQGEEFDAAEGFWIDRPWQLSSTCPAQTRPDGEPTAAPAATAPSPSAAANAVRTQQTLGIVELFEPDAKREGQRKGRAYEAVQTVEPGTLALEQGLRLVVEGRLVTFADGQAIGCRSRSADQRPICFVRVQFDRIAITDPSGEQSFAEWKS